MPTDCSFLMRQVCEMVSNALVKSMNTAATTFPLSIAIVSNHQWFEEEHLPLSDQVEIQTDGM